MTVGRVIYSPRAKRDLLEITDWISRDSLDAALRVVDRIDEVLNLLVDHPAASEVVDHLLPGLRRTSSGSYVIYYRRQGDNLDVVRIVHGARDIDQVFE